MASLQHKLAEYRRDATAMNIVIFTPAIRKSAIGRMASLVTKALTSLGHDVIIVRTERESLFSEVPHDFGVELIAWTDRDRVATLINQTDGLVYQIGDNYEYHCGAVEWLTQFSGVVCLHDYYLGGLFWQWAQASLGRANTILHDWYGEEEAKKFFAFLDTDAHINHTKDRAPMTEWICAMACAVLTHSSWGIQRVLDSCPGPVHVTPLAYSIESVRVNKMVPNVVSGKSFRVLTVGHVNTNKRVASVIRAIGNSPLLRERTAYHLVGEISPGAVDSLSSLARANRVNLVIYGTVSDEKLESEFEQADIVMCLRWPSLEAASASAIEAMLYGKTTVVTDTGFYKELPDDCVKKIDCGNELPALQEALEDLYDNEEARLAMGAAAKAWAERTFTPDNYACQLIDIVRSSNKVRPVIDAVAFFLRNMNSWGASENLITLESTTAPLRLFNRISS